MDNKTRKILNQMVEKCEKLNHYTSKAMRFGLFSHHPNNKNKTNGDEIIIAYYKLQNYIEILQDNHVLPRYSKDYIATIKRNDIKNIKYNK